MTLRYNSSYVTTDTSMRIHNKLVQYLSATEEVSTNESLRHLILAISIIIFTFPSTFKKHLLYENDEAIILNI